MRILLLCVAGLILGISGCTYLRNNNEVTIPRNNQQSIPPLKVPPGMSMSFNTLYPIPPAHFSNTKQVNISPPSLYTKLKSDNT